MYVSYLFCFLSPVAGRLLVCLMPFVIAVRRKKRAKVLLFSELAKLFCIFFAFHAFYVEKLLYFCSRNSKNSMLVTTEAIVLNLQRHSDRSHILHTYTRSGGRINFMVYGAGSKKKSAALYAPLSLIEITADIRPDRPVPTLKEAHLLQPDTQESRLRQGTQDSRLGHRPRPMEEASVKMFLAEVLFRILRHPMPDEALFQFLADNLLVLDGNTALERFHTDFLVGFAAQLGFAIDSAEHPELLRVPVSRSDRQQLLRQLCDYYSLHIEDFRPPLSLDVLIEVFD